MSTVTDPFRQRSAARAAEADVRRNRELAAASADAVDAADLLSFRSPAAVASSATDQRPRAARCCTARWRWAAIIIGTVLLACVGVLLGSHKGRGWIAQMRRAAGWIDRPTLLYTKPASGDTAAPREGTIIAKLRLTSGLLRPESLSGDAVTLTRSNDGQRISAAVELGSRGDAILIHPDKALDASTSYTLSVTDAVRDTSDVKITPFSVSFTTRPPADPSIRFQKIALPTASRVGFTCVVIGPDHRLYAGSDDGRIYRFPIETDGTLGTPEVITSLQQANGGPRLLSGFCFDPASTPEHPVIWASNSAFAFHNAPDFAGKLTRISGENLSDVQDVLVNLPRSFKDHLNLQPVFGPDGAIYFSQGSNSAYGAPDEEWGMRAEHLLNATILRVDPRKLPASLPVDVKTPDAGGSYDPAAPGAPVTIYARGLRLAYDLCWARNGQLYAPANGSSAGGNTPAGNGTPALENIPENEDDWLFRITPGKYYGHPNPQQGQYVLNGGNPTAGDDFAEVPQYPVGTKPDPDWQPAIYDFGVHISPDGVVQYSGNAFEGKLDGRLLVCRYNNGSDILVITLDEAGNVASAESGFVGMGGFANPLDITEDTATGNLYVAEYGARKITLLRPAPLVTPAAANRRT